MNGSKRIDRPLDTDPREYMVSRISTLYLALTEFKDNQLIFNSIAIRLNKFAGKLNLLLGPQLWEKLQRKNVFHESQPIAWSHY